MVAGELLRAYSGAIPRAQALAAIVVVGPDAVAAAMVDIDAYLGKSSPGQQWLCDCVVDAREAMSPGQDPVRHQHLISEVVLGHFSRPPRGNQRVGDVQSYDLKLCQQRKPAQPSGLGWTSDYFKVDSRRMEELWGSVETRLPLAYQAANASDVPKDGTVLETFREAAILHFVRNPTLAESHNVSWEKVQNNYYKRLIREIVLANPGLPLAGILAGLSRQRMGKLNRDGGTLFRLEAERQFENWRAMLASAPIEFVRPAKDEEFLIGDVPVLAYREVDGALAPAIHIGLNNADSLVFPIASDLLLRIHFRRGGPSFATVATAGRVAEFNKAQVLAARRVLDSPARTRPSKSSVYYRPGAKFQAVIAQWLADAGAASP